MFGWWLGCLSNWLCACVFFQHGWNILDSSNCFLFLHFFLGKCSFLGEIHKNKLKIKHPKNGRYQSEIIEMNDFARRLEIRAEQWWTRTRTFQPRECWLSVFSISEVSLHVCLKKSFLAKRLFFSVFPGYHSCKGRGLFGDLTNQKNHVWCWWLDQRDGILQFVLARPPLKIVIFSQTVGLSWSDDPKFWAISDTPSKRQWKTQRGELGPTLMTSVGQSRLLPEKCELDKQHIKAIAMTLSQWK